jgi:PAS domain S-box-containing protein
MIEELKQAEFSLAEGQRLAHMGSWTFDTGGFVSWSSELFRIHGLEPAGKAPSIPEYMAFVHPEDRVFVAQAIQQMLRTRRGLDFTKRIVRPDGAIRWVRCVGTRTSHGSRLVGTGIDVTEQEELTQALRKNEETLRMLIDGIDALIITMTADDELEFVNQQVLDFFGKSGEEMKDWRQNGAIHPHDLGAVIAAWTDSVQTGRPYDHVHRYRRSDGVCRWFRVRGRPARDTQGRIVRWYVILSDIDERKRAEERLEEQQQELQQVLDLTPQMVAVFGRERERLYANSVALAYIGTSLKEWRQQGIGSELHPDDVERVVVAAKRGVSTRSAYELEVRIRKSDGTYRWFLARFNPMCVDHGRPSRWYVACTDIEDRKKAEERLLQENVALREEIDNTSMFEEIVGAAPALAATLSRVAKVACSDSTVLISGLAAPARHSSP